MAKPGKTSPAAVLGLMLAASAFAVTLYLNQSHQPSSLIMSEQRNGQTEESLNHEAALNEREAR